MTDAEARAMARELVRGSIVEDAVSQFIAQVLKHAHDERIKPLRKQVADLESKLAQAVEALEFYATQDVIYPHVGKVTFTGYDDDGRLARATLAEIKGESHE